METTEMKQLLDAIDVLSKKIEMLPTVLSEIKHEYRSQKTNELIAAFAIAQSEYPPIHVNKTDSYWKNEYADLDAIMSVIRPVLSKNGLVFYQYMEPNDITILHSRLMHVSDQWISSRARIIPTKNDLQNYACAKIFMQGQSAMELLNITIKNNPFDDNADREMSYVRTTIEKGTDPTNYKPKEQSHNTINTENLKELEYELAEWPDIAQMVLDKLHLTSLADMPASRYRESIERIRSIKNLRLGIKPN